MNRNRYRLVFNLSLRMMVPVAESARTHGKSTSAPALVLAGVILAGAAQAELPVPSAGGAIPSFVTAGQAAYQVNGAQALVNQVGNKSILNWQSFNVSAGHNVQFRQVDSLAAQNLVQGASFTSLNRIHDINPSVIAGSISQAAGQQANVILVNTNGIAFMGGSQVNLNSFTATSLNIQNNFILDSFLGNTLGPQFEGTTGFIKVFEGAKITAGSQGRVMLLAPTVVNKGKVEAPDGQVITAAATKVYLRSDSVNDPNVRGLLVEVDSPTDLNDFETANPDVKNGVLDGASVALINPAEDKLGHVTNLGELSAARGNVTMVGYAVNQLGIARATTSVVANGSVYLLAKDRPANVGTDAITSSRAGRVLLGANSLTEVLPDVIDSTTGLDGTTGSGLAKASQVQVLGQDIRMAGGAVIDAPSGEVKFSAIDNPNDLRTGSTTNPFLASTSPNSSVARIHIASGARINVAGLENVQISAARNAVEVELRGDELKDSPINQQGPLRGQKAYLDVNRALANANAGKSTLIAKDSLESYQGRLERTVAERSTRGGTVSLRSQGETILASGAVVDLSGGSVQYTAANVKTTILTSGGKLEDLADANAETRYDGIATRFVRDFGRWNVTEVIDLGQSFRHDPGYVEGKSAGALDVIGLGGTFMQADIQGRTTVGELQRNAGIAPTGVRLTFGTNSVADDYKLNQRVEVSGIGALLPTGFKFGDALPQALKDTLSVNPNLLGQDKVAQLEIFSNQAVVVREVLRTSQGGSVNIIGSDVTVNADIEATAGAITLAARNTGRIPLTVSARNPQLSVADDVTFSVRGRWVNDLPGAAQGANGIALLNGGKISLSAQVSGNSVGTYDDKGTVNLGQNTVLDASGGGRVQADGRIVAGNGGDVSVAGFAVTGGNSGLNGNVRAYGLGKGGKITLSSNKIQVGGTPDTDTSAVNLDTAFFERGGFADFNLIALDSVTVADGAVVTPTVQNFELQPEYQLAATGSKIEAFTRIVKQDDRVRQAANLSLVAEQVEANTGSILIGAGARIQANPKAKIELKARRLIEIQGNLLAAGGTITALLDGNSGQLKPIPNINPIWLGKNAVLDVSGSAQTYTDSRGLVQGEVLAGGAVNLNAKTGYVVTEAGSLIDVSGAAPVRLDTRNEAGGLGRMVGSDAGKLTVFAEEGMLLDGSLAAQAGSPSNRGGAFSATLSKNAGTESQTGFDTESRVLSVAQTGVPQAAGLTPDSAIPNDPGVRARLSAAQLEDAGFDRITLASRDAIQLEDGLNLGANRALPLREVTLDAARIETTGGDAKLTAETVRLGNYSQARRGAEGATSGTGTFTADAQLLELVGDLRLNGMARAELKGSQQIRFSGLTRTRLDPVTGRPVSPLELEHTGSLKSSADLVFHGAVVAPTTYTQFNILAAGKTVEFTRNTNTPLQPFSALGSLSVNALDIIQDGNIWAPFGRLNFQASNTLTFKNGSLTSVSAAPGSLIPFGKVQNGRTWIYDLEAGNIPTGQIKQTELAEKSIRLSATDIDMQAGAKINLTGGGDLQAYEFTVGPGGSRDILNSAGVYAILPGYASAFAPSDVQENFDRAPGEAVYLSGVPGLSEGTYTLLPAHYALLPGAYAVRLNTGIKDLLPGQSYSKQDGVRVAAGYVTDNRNAAPRDARWSGFEVLTREQVLARSEITLTRASSFFADGRNRPQDAGLLSIATNGTGSNSLKFDAIYELGAGSGGRGAAVDISALKIALTSGTPSGIDPTATRLDVDTLNALGAESLFIGGTRSASGDTTTLTVGAETVTLANDADHALKAAEVILAATDTVTLKSGSLIDAQGDAGDAGHYETAGEGALVRAAFTTASFARTGSPGTTRGTLDGEAGSKIIAAASITLDATKENAFKGATEFKKDGAVVAGNLGVGATRINFGAAPAGSEGITYSQTDLDALNNLKGLALTSYNTFDLYGDVNVGGVDVNGKPTLQNLTLQGAGLAGINTGINNSGKTATLRAQNLTLSNPALASFTPGGELGDGTLAVLADTLTLGEGNKSVQGFSAVTITANELVAQDIGTTNVAAPLTLNVVRIGGARGADQTLTVNGKLTAAKHVADRVLAPVNALGAQWALAGTSVDFNTKAVLPSGVFKLTATSGDVILGPDAGVDVAGRTVQFFEVSRPTWGGTAEFISETGNVTFGAGAKVDVSAAAGGDAGTLIARATQGTVTLADGSVQGAAPVDTEGKRGDGAQLEIDTGTLANLSVLNTALNSGGFDGERNLRVRSGDVSVLATDQVKANTIRIAADGGKLDVKGQLDASGEEAGRIELFAKNDVNLLAEAQLDAFATGAGKAGGEVEIGTRDGSLNFDADSRINVAGGSGGEGGEVLLRALRTHDDTDVAVNGLASPGIITGARSVSVEAVKVYDNISTLTASGGSGATLSLAKITSDNTAFAANHAAIKTRLGKTLDSAFHILSGVEVRSSDDLTLASNWNLSTSRANAEPGVLTLRAQGNLLLNNNLSDGFNVATPFSAGTTPATLLSGESWSYRLIAGADGVAADPLTVRKGGGDVILAANRLVRTGTGDIDIAAGGNITLTNTKSVIYTAGRIADPVSNFVAPPTTVSPQFSQSGGNVSLTALGDIVGTPSGQLYSDWLFRQGRLNDAATTYTLRPAWWVRFDLFEQGIGALGGGDVSITAGGRVENVSASTPTQARMTSATPDASKLVTTGGGNVRVKTGKDLLGGQYYADRGELLIKAGGKVESGQEISGKLVYTILALGDATARVQARGDVNIHTILNPHLVVQSEGGGSVGATIYNVGPGGAAVNRRSIFSTYGANSGADLESLNGKVVLHHAKGSEAVANISTVYRGLFSGRAEEATYVANLSFLPPSLAATAFQGDVRLDGNAENFITLSPAAEANLTLLAANSVTINTALSMSDRELTQIPDATHPVSLLPPNLITPAPAFRHAAIPIHSGDTTPVRIYAVNQDVQGVQTLKLGGSPVLDTAKAIQVRAGRDIRDLAIEAQHPNTGDISRLVAGRDIIFASGSLRTNSDRIWVGGPGRLEVSAGRNIDLGTSGGIVSKGDLENNSLPKGGATIQIEAGVGANGVDYTGAVDRLLAKLEAGAPDDALLWQARWLTADDTLAPGDALAAVRAVDALNADAQRDRVRSMLYTALRETGRDSNKAESPYAGDYARGYAAIELLFPGIGEKNPDGSSKHYQGDLNLFASRIKTDRGGNIEFMLPGGDLIVGLANTPEAIAKDGNDALGIVTVAGGDVKGFSLGDILVNQSRILTVSGGDILLWSSEGDIDAGKGKKTATAVPPPVINVNPQTGNVTQELQGAASGSGIGALFTGDVAPGDVDLVAPEGTVDAGDAGIRAGNLNIAAQVVLGADNITVSGSSAGTPVADTSAVSAASSGASNADGGVSDATKTLSQGLSDAARVAEELKQSFKPTFISAEVIGHGDCEPGEKPPCKPK